MAKKIKVSGYTKKEHYLGDISYRPFNPIAKPLRPDAVFTSGNFSIISNIDEKLFKEYVPNNYSKYYSLSDLGFTKEDINTIYNKDRLSINFDPHNLKNYAYFGSLKEYMRITLEKIIMTFPAGIIIYPYYEEDGKIVRPDLPVNGDYLTFNIKQFKNPFGLKLRASDSNPENQLRDLTLNYESYVLSNISNDLNVKDFVVNNDIISINAGKYGYALRNNIIYLKPNEKEFEKFYKNLNELGRVLLNRYIHPTYTYKFNKKVFVPELGYHVLGTVSGTWPTSDGYNIDFDNSLYYEYVEELIKLCDEFDEEDGNIIVRQLTTSSILEFDTVPSLDNDNIFDDGQKIKTLLSIYGRSFDESKKYIDGLKYANTVTYDGIDNTPDDVISSIARTLGWNLFNKNEIINEANFFKKSFYGSRELPHLYTKEHAKKEIFKRLIINSPWFYKSKGTRKVINFFNKFLNVPNGLIDFKEYVYVAKNKLDYNKISDIYNNFNTEYMSTNNVFVDNKGYPVVNKNTDDDYFHMAGRWHQETTGLNAPYEINTGNNPHTGPYDSGSSYLNKYKNLIPNFSPTSIITKDLKEINKTIFSETFYNYTIGDITNLSNTIVQQRFNITGSIERIYPAKKLTNDCGCTYDSLEKTLRIGAKTQNDTFACNYNILNLGSDNLFRFYKDTTLIEPTVECCSGIGGQTEYSYKYNKNVCTLVPLVECERYVYQSMNASGFQVFLDQKTSVQTTVVPLAECCRNGAVAASVSGGFNCNAGSSISGKCIKIDSIEMFYEFTPNPDLSVIFTNASTNRIKTNTYTSVSTGPLSTDIILRSNRTDNITLVVKDKSTTSLTVQSFIDNSGEVVGSFNGHRLVINNSAAITAINYSYVDCPPLNYDDICIKFISATFEGLPSPQETPPILGLMYTNSVNRVRTSFNMGFTGNGFSIEDNSTVLSVYDIPIDVNLTTNQSNYYGLDLKTALDYSKLIIGKTETISFTFPSGIKANFVVLPIKCVSCPYLDPVSEVVYDKKKYINFNILGTSDFTTEVPSPECCPTYTTPENYQTSYRCFTGEYVIDDNCEEQLTPIIDMYGYCYTMPPSSNGQYINNRTFDVLQLFGGVNSVIENNHTFIAPVTGEYKIEYAGYASSLWSQTPDGPYEYRQLTLQPYLNNTGVLGSIFMRFENDYGNPPSTNPPLNTFYLNLTAGDKLSFVYNKTFQDGYYKGTIFTTDGTLKISTNTLVCGCPSKLETTVYAYNEINKEATYRKAFSSASVKIINGSDVKTYTLNLTNRATDVFTGFNIKSDTKIVFTNFCEVDNAKYYGTISNDEYTCTGLEVLTSIVKVIRVMYKGTGNVLTVRDFYLSNDCNNIPAPPYRILPDIGNYTLSGVQRWLHPSSLKYTFEVKQASDVYLKLTGSFNPSSQSSMSLSVPNNIPTYLITNDVESTTPDQWNMFNVSDDSPFLCPEGLNDINALSIHIKMKMPVGNHNISMSGQPGVTYCTPNGNAAFLMCGLSPEDISINNSTTAFLNMAIEKGVGLSQTLFHDSFSSVDYCSSEIR